MRNPAWWATFIVANSLSLARLFAGLLFPLLSVSWRPAVAVAAAASDGLDGALSRRFHAASTVGRLLDPVADKVFVIMVVGTLWMEGSLAWWEIVLVGLRDLVVTGIAVWLCVTRNWAGFLAMPPRWSGKIATGAQFGFIFSRLAAFDIPGVLWLTAAASGLAGADYLRLFLIRLKAPSTVLDPSSG